MDLKIEQDAILKVNGFLNRLEESFTDIEILALSEHKGKQSRFYHLEERLKKQPPSDLCKTLIEQLGFDGL